jgi:hypothetical protein
MVQVLTAPELLMCPGKMLGGKGTEQRDLAGKHTSTNDLPQFFGIGTRRISAASYAKDPQAFLLRL